jgi:MFS family permease
LLVQLSFGAGWTSEWALTVAIGVVAFRDGGATAVGLIAFLRMGLPALLAPFSSALADRFRREHVLMWSSLVRAVSIGSAALVLATGGALVWAYALTILAACAFVVFRAANSALLPMLCVEPLELTSATLSRGLMDSISMLLGPLAAGVLLGFATPAAAFTLVAALSLVSGLLLVGVSYETPRLVASPPLRRIVIEAAEGFRALARYRDAGLLVVLAAAQTFTRGCLAVFMVVLAFELLKTGQVGVAALTGAVGAGATVGSLGALLLVSGRRLAAIEGIGVALWGLPLTLSGALPYGPVVLGLMCVVGAGNALVDVGLFTLLARIVPDDILLRVFGALESLIALTVAVGSLITPFVIALVGVRAALALLGLVAPVVVVLGWSRLRTIDRLVVRRDDEIAVLRRVRLLQPLPMPMIETLAAHVTHRVVAQGRDVFRQGDVGDRFYVIEDGTAEVIGDGRPVQSLGRGDCFGEIALLHDTPRTATVRARTELRLSSLERPDFLLAVSNYSASAREAESLLNGRLAAFTPCPPG